MSYLDLAKRVIAELHTDSQPEDWPPICEVRCLYRRRDEIEVLEVQPISPPGQTRWEWRSVRGKYVAELKGCTTDPTLAREWVAALRAADSGDVDDG